MLRDSGLDHMYEYHVACNFFIFVISSGYFTSTETFFRAIGSQKAASRRKDIGYLDKFLGIEG